MENVRPNQGLQLIQTTTMNVPKMTESSNVMKRRLRLISLCGALAPWIALTATAQDGVIKPKEPEDADARILQTFESKLEPHPGVRTELRAEDRDRVDPRELLEAFVASKRSERAFTALVENLRSLVYSSALRRTSRPQLAEEVTKDDGEAQRRQMRTV